MARVDGVSNELIGTWKLVSVQFEDAGTGERHDMHGQNPEGYLILTDGARMVAVITPSGRAAPRDDADCAALFKGMTAYTGKFQIGGGDKFVTTVDVAWNPAWIGTEQTRFFTLDGDTLFIRSAEQTHPMYPGRLGRGVLMWQRV